MAMAEDLRTASSLLFKTAAADTVLANYGRRDLEKEARYAK